MRSDSSREATHNSKHPGFMSKCLGASNKQVTASPDDLRSPRKLYSMMIGGVPHSVYLYRNFKVSNKPKLLNGHSRRRSIISLLCKVMFTFRRAIQGQELFSTDSKLGEAWTVGKLEMALLYDMQSMYGGL